MASFDYDEADVRRFFLYVDKLPNGCWFYTGCRSRGTGNRKWYGTFTAKGKRLRAHRFSCEAIGGRSALPAGYHRDHICCFSLCVNPDHLEYVTHSENEKLKQKRRVGVGKEHKK